MNEREAMKQALEWLDRNSWPDFDKWAQEGKEVRNALRQALANEALDRMAENARELGLDYDAKPDEPFAWCIESIDSADWCFAKTKEGVEFNAVLMDDDCVKTEPFPLYTRPQPAAQWVGLTDEKVKTFAQEHLYCEDSHYNVEQGIEGWDDFARAIDQALKEKNTCKTI